MPKLQGWWKSANSILRNDLEASGWWDTAAGARRMPYYIDSAALTVATIAALVLMIAGKQP